MAGALTLACLPARAQDWATYEVCFPQTIEVSDAALAPFTLEGLEQAAQAIPNATGKYWRITAPNGAVSHLWGTMHSNHPRVLDLPDLVEADLRAARAVALEVDYTFTSRQAYGRWVRADDILRTDSMPSRFGLLGLPTDVEGWIRDRTAGIGWRRDAPDTLTLAGLAQMILGDPCSDFRAGIYPGQDGRIQMLGTIEGAQVFGLEEPEDFLNKLSDPQNFDLTRAMITVYGAYLNPARTAESTATALALYLRGQMGVWMLLDRGYIMSLYGEDRGRDLLALTSGYLVEERNRKFVSRALMALGQGDVFIAVGGFHLPGETGMIELLRKEGYDVTRVRLPGEAAQ